MLSTFGKIYFATKSQKHQIYSFGFQFSEFWCFRVLVAFYTFRSALNVTSFTF